MPSGFAELAPDHKVGQIGLCLNCDRPVFVRVGSPHAVHAATELRACKATPATIAKPPGRIADMPIDDGHYATSAAYDEATDNAGEDILELVRLAGRIAAAHRRPDGRTPAPTSTPDSICAHCDGAIYFGQMLDEDGVVVPVTNFTWRHRGAYLGEAGRDGFRACNNDFAAFATPRLDHHA